MMDVATGTREDRIAALRAEGERIYAELGPLMDAKRREEAEAFVGGVFKRRRQIETAYLLTAPPRQAMQYARCAGVEGDLPIFSDVFSVCEDGEVTIDWRDGQMSRGWGEQYARITREEYEASVADGPRCGAGLPREDPLVSARPDLAMLLVDAVRLVAHRPTCPVTLLGAPDCPASCSCYEERDAKMVRCIAAALEEAFDQGWDGAKADESGQGSAASEQLDMEAALAVFKATP